MPEIQLTEADAGKLVALERGDELVVTLHESPASTGFQWEREPMTEGRLTSRSVTFRQPVTGVGGGGVRIFRLCASAPGTEELRLKLFRPDGAVDRRFNVTVAVSERAG